MGHFVLYPRERKKRDRIDNRDEREGQERKRNRNESEETEEIKTFPTPSTLTCRPCPTVSQYQLDRDVRYTTPLPHPTTNKGCTDQSAKDLPCPLSDKIRLAISHEIIKIEYPCIICYNFA